MKRTSIACAVVLTTMLYTTSCEKAAKTEAEIGENSREMAKAVVVATDSTASETTHFFKKLFARKKVKTEEVTKESKASVQQLYPEMEIIEWETAPEYIVESRNDTTEIFEVVDPEIYIVTLKKDNELTKAKLHRKGQFIESRKSLTKEKFPSSIQETLKKGIYKDWNVTSEGEEIKHVAEKELLYRVVLEKDKQKQVLYFKKDGTLVKTLNPV
ncbi:MAG: hypothetical protein JWO58_1597 [Chitinophagaceae bacterium]|nr:hypothetical protein [Chitinophagaceae bacterium]